MRRRIWFNGDGSHPQVAGKQCLLETLLGEFLGHLRLLASHFEEGRWPLRLLKLRSSGRAWRRGLILGRRDGAQHVEREIVRHSIVRANGWRAARPLLGADGALRCGLLRPGWDWQGGGGRLSVPGKRFSGK